MKKILFTLLAVFALIATASAQTMKVYRDGELKAVYSVTKGDRVEFSDDFPFPDDYNGHEYVDLGLHSGLKWATCNVGASSPEETGDFFAWGETEPKETYEWSNYIWCDGSSDKITKYCNSSSYGTVDDKTVLDPEDDAAHVNWGGTWRMPTYEDVHELVLRCTWEWEIRNDVPGYKVVGPNGNSIFLPAAGSYAGGEYRDLGIAGNYLSSSLYLERCDNAYFLSIVEGFFNYASWDYDERCIGRTVRPVSQ